MADYIGLKLLITKQIEMTQQMQEQMQQLAAKFDKLQTQVQEWIDMEETNSEYTLDTGSQANSDDDMLIEFVVAPVNSPVD